MDLEEASVTCPCCWETIVLTLDLSAGSQEYVEDCPVCCRPLRVRLAVEEPDGSFGVTVASEDD
jgi:hypothetical protein